MHPDYTMPNLEWSEDVHAWVTRPVLSNQVWHSVGVDLGLIRDHSAITVVKAQPRLRKPADWLENRPPEFETSYQILGLERLPLGTSYTAVGERVCQLAKRLRNRERGHIVCLIDQTGVGSPVVQAIRERIVPDVLVCGVTIVGGNKWDANLIWKEQGTVSKVALVSRLQALLQTQRIKGPKSRELQALIEELEVFEIRTKPTGNPESGSFTNLVNDDLCISLGLACCADFADITFSPGLSSWGSPNI